MLSVKGLSPSEYLKAQYEKRSRLLESYAQKQAQHAVAKKDDANLRTFIQDILADEDCETEEEATALPQGPKSMSSSSGKLNSKVMSTNLNIKVHVPPKLWSKVLNQLNKYSCNAAENGGREHEDERDSDESADEERNECSGGEISYSCHAGSGDDQNGWQANRNNCAELRRSEPHGMRISAERKESLISKGSESGDWHVDAHKSILRETESFAIYVHQNEDDHLPNYNEEYFKSENGSNFLWRDRSISQSQVRQVSALKSQDLINALKPRNVGQVKCNGLQNGKENQMPEPQNFMQYLNVPAKQTTPFQFCNTTYKKSDTPCCQYHNIHSLILLKALQEIGQPASPQELIDYITKVSHVHRSVVFQVVHSLLNWSENAAFLRRISDFYYINYKDLFDLNPQLFYQLNQPESTAELCNLSGFIGGQQFPVADGNEPSFKHENGKKKSCKRRKKQGKKEQFWKKKKSKKFVREPPKRFLLY